MGCGESGEAKIEITAIEFPDGEKAEAHEDHVEEKGRIGEEAVDGEHGSKGEVVALKVGEVVIDPALDFAEVGRLGETLEVEEFSYGLEI